MKNASLPCLTATAGTRFGQDTLNVKTIFNMASLTLKTCHRSGFI